MRKEGGRIAIIDRRCRRLFMVAVIGEGARLSIRRSREHDAANFHVGVPELYTTGQSGNAVVPFRFPQSLKIRVDYRWAGADADCIRSAATELLDLKPDTILAMLQLTVAQAGSSDPRCGLDCCRAYLSVIGTKRM